LNPYSNVTLAREAAATERSNNKCRVHERRTAE
jgi:hypothetical protein